MQQAWDKNGLIYYIDDNGNRVQPKNTLNAFQKLGNDFKALKTNVKNAIDNLGIERSHTYFAPFNELKNAYESGFIGKRELPYLSQGRADQEIREANKQQKGSNIQNVVGTTISGLSAHPVLNIPYVGTGLGGAVYELGQGIASGDNVGDVIDRTGQGFIVGETVGAIPYVGKGLGKTKVGQAVSEKATQGLSKLAETPLGQKVGNWASKAEDVLMSDIKAFNPFKQTQTVYHGSPYDFTKFSNKAIGTGEGVQAHGVGHYAAKSKDVADKRYRKRLTTSSKEEVEINNRYKPLFEEAEKKYDDYIGELYKQKQEGKITEEVYQNAIDNSKEAIEVDNILASWTKEVESLKGKKLTPNEGQLYKLSIPKDDVMLREDLPLSKQPLKVQEAINKINRNLGISSYDDLNRQSIDISNQIKSQYNFDNINWQKVRELENLQDEITKKMLAANPSITGKKYYENIGKNSNLLNQHGIKGISYNGGIDGEANVIFNPDDIQIVRKYYNQPQAMKYFQNLQPSLGAVVNSFEHTPVNTKEWKQYAKNNLIGKSVDVPGYTTVNFTNKNLGKDYPYNMPEYPTLLEDLANSQYAFSSNYNNETDRLYGHLVNNKKGLFDYLIEVIQDPEGNIHHNYKMMKNINRGDKP